MLVQQLGAVLEQLSAAAEPFVGHKWREVPSYTAFFGAIFLAALPFWRYVVGVGWRRAAILSSCSMSSVHGILSSLCGYQQLLAWQGFQVDLPNTLPQKLLNEFSFGYMIADLFFFLLPFTPEDAVFVVHHIISSIYLIGCLLHGHGAIGCILMFFLGEVTSPIFNTYSISKELQHHSKAAGSVFRVMDPVFIVAFVSIRSVVAPPIVAWFIYKLWFRAQLIPLGWRVAMGSCVVMGMLASQLWSYMLLRDWSKQRRQARQMEETKKEA